MSNIIKFPPKEKDMSRDKESIEYDIFRRMPTKSKIELLSNIFIIPLIWTAMVIYLIWRS